MREPNTSYKEQTNIVLQNFDIGYLIENFSSRWTITEANIDFQTINVFLQIFVLLYKIISPARFGCHRNDHNQNGLFRKVYSPINPIHRMLTEIIWDYHLMWYLLTLAWILRVRIKLWRRYLWFFEYTGTRESYSE